MTRFIMTLKESVDLILYAINNGDSGDIVVPKLKSCYIKDLIQLFSKHYNKSVFLGKLRHGEKINESLINQNQLIRAIETNNYYHIKPSYKSNIITNTNLKNYNSSANILTEIELINYINSLNLL